jgi:starch synthase
MYAMHYGAVPVVRSVGGLADTVTDLERSPREGTGFTFDEPTSEALVEVVRRAIDVYRDRRIWPALRRRCMKQDFSWWTSARAYLDLYEEALLSARARIPGGP